MRHLGSRPPILAAPADGRKKCYLLEVDRVRRFRVPLESIAYVRMIVEGYEGLAVVSSEAGRGVIEWDVAPGREAEADALALALGRETGLHRVG